MAHGLAKGAVGQLARRSGLPRTEGRRGPNAVDLLQEDHERVKMLFDRFAQSGERAQPVIARQIFEELDLHARVEEEVFYPALASIGQEAADLVAISTQEHQIVRDLIVDLRRLSLQDRCFTERFDALRENVLDHAAEEEETAFPAARLNLDLYELGWQMTILKKAGQAVQRVWSVGAFIRRYPAYALLMGASILVVLSRSLTLARR